MIYDQELQVAPPRGRNLQLPEESHATVASNNATDHATVDLKALADSCLERKQCNQPCNHDATEEQKTMQLSGIKIASKVASVVPVSPREIESIIRWLRDDVGHDLGEQLTAAVRHTMRPLDQTSRVDLCAVIDDAFEAAENLIDARHKALALLPSTSTTTTPETPAEWVEWIAEQCPLLPDDHYFIEHRLAMAKAQYREALARLYVKAWRRGEEAESSSLKKTNAGRRTANMTLLPSAGNSVQIAADVVPDRPSPFDVTASRDVLTILKES